MRLAGIPLSFTPAGAKVFCPDEFEDRLSSFLRSRGMGAIPGEFEASEYYSAILSCLSMSLGFCAQAGLCIFSARNGIEIAQIGLDGEVKEPDTFLQSGSRIALPLLEPVTGIAPLDEADCESLGIDALLYACRTVLMYSVPMTRLDTPVMVRRVSGDSVVPSWMVLECAKRSVSGGLKDIIVSYFAEWKERFPRNPEEKWERAQQMLEQFSFRGGRSMRRRIVVQSFPVSHQRATVDDPLLEKVLQAGLSRSKASALKFDEPKTPFSSSRELAEPVSRPRPGKPPPRPEMGKDLQDNMREIIARASRAALPSQSSSSEEEETLSLSCSEEATEQDEESTTLSLSSSELLSVQQSDPPDASLSDLPCETSRDSPTRLWTAKARRVSFSPIVMVLSADGEVCTAKLDGSRKPVLQRGREVSPSVLKHGDGVPVGRCR